MVLSAALVEDDQQVVGRRVWVIPPGSGMNIGPFEGSVWAVADGWRAGKNRRRIPLRAVMHDYRGLGGPRRVNEETAP